jgi:hypothetical protein
VLQPDKPSSIPATKKHVLFNILLFSLRINLYKRTALQDSATAPLRARLKSMVARYAAIEKWLASFTKHLSGSASADGESHPSPLRCNVPFTKHGRQLNRHEAARNEISSAFSKPDVTSASFNLNPSQ